MVYHALALLCRGLAAGFKFPRLSKECRVLMLSRVYSSYSRSDRVGGKCAQIQLQHKGFSS